MKHFCYKRYNCNIIKKKFISKLKAAKLSLIFIYVSNYVPVAQWLEHCVSSAKVVGSIPREHTYWQYKCIAWMHCKSLWIKASAKYGNGKLITKWKISKHLERKREWKKGLLPFFTSFGLHSELKMAKPYSINNRLSSALVSATLFITVSLFYSFWL